MTGTPPTVSRAESVSAVAALTSRARRGTAVSRAQARIRVGAYGEAVRFLDKHVPGKDDALDVAYWDARVVASLYGAASPWRPAMENLLELGPGCAPDEWERIQLLHATQCVEAGELQEAETILAGMGEPEFLAPTRLADFACVQSQLQVRQGLFWEAHATLERASKAFDGTRHTPQAARLALRRARVFAYLGRSEAMTRELLRVRRYSAALGNPSLGRQAAMLCAEAMLLLGDHRRALRRLNRLGPRIATSENQFNVAHYNKLQAWALLDEDVESAIACADHAREIYARIELWYHVAWCDVLRAAACLRRGDDPTRTLAPIDRHELAKWPILDAEYVVLCGAYDPTVAPSLGDAQAELGRWAVGSGYCALPRRLPGAEKLAEASTSDAWPETIPDEVTQHSLEVPPRHGLMTDDSVRVGVPGLGSEAPG